MLWTLGAAALFGVAIGLRFKVPMLLLASVIGAPLPILLGVYAGRSMAVGAIGTIVSLLVLQLSYLVGVTLSHRLRLGLRQDRLPRLFPRGFW